jgi:hypothetical protein
MDALLITIILMLGLLAGITIHEHFAYTYSKNRRIRTHKKTGVKQIKNYSGWEQMN